MTRSKYWRRGHITLVEILMAVVILGVLSAIAVPQFTKIDPVPAPNPPVRALNLDDQIAAVRRDIEDARGRVDLCEQELKTRQDDLDKLKGTLASLERLKKLESGQGKPANDKS